MKIWVSYSRVDREHLNLFESEIRRQSNNQISVLSDKRTFTEDNFNIEIFKRILSSDLQVLIISPGFIKSEFCDFEMGFMNTPKMDNKPIYAIALSDFDIKSLNDTTDKNLLTILQKSPLWRLSETDRSENSEGQNCTWKEFAKEILRKLEIRTNDNPSLTDYRKHILEGRFVPFIGTECYGLKEDWLPVLPKLAERFKKLVNKLDTEHDVDFVRAVVESRAPGFSPVESSIGSNQQFDASSSVFIGLRVSIAQAGAAASRILGRSLSTCKGLIDARHFSLKSSAEKDPDAQILREALTSASGHAASRPIVADCLNGSEASRMCLGASGIATKLEILKKCIFQPGKIDENSTSTENDSFLVLTLSQLDWLCDLLWHTMRFDLPILPRNDELAFQLSVCQASDCLVRVPLGTAGVISAKSDNTKKETDRGSIASGHEKCTHLIYRHLNKNRQSRLSNRSKNFYHSIAKILYQPFMIEESKQDNSSKSGSAQQVADLLMPKDGNNQDNSPKSGSVQEVVDLLMPKDGSRPNCPMAVSVNMDTELEYCLKNVEYSVVTPVQTTEGKIPAWMLRINNPNGRNHDEFYLLSQNARFWEHVEDKLKGPLILKLRGSTLHELPPDHCAPENWLGSKNKKISNSATIENRLLLSSLEYARELSDPKMGEPLFINELLSEPLRVMCFFGYPLDDPDGLLGIQRSVWIAESTENQKELPEKISIGCDRHDGLGNAFLSGLNVEPLGLDLNKVADEINNIPGLKDLPDKEV